MKRWMLLSFWLMCLWCYQAAAAETLWVTSLEAKLKANRSAYSETLAVLPRGTELQQLAYETRWYRVATLDGQSGWIYRGNVSSTQPETETDQDDSGALDDLFADMSDSSIEADAADSSRSIRGLSPEAEEYARQTKTPQAYRQALDDVLAIRIGPDELDKFKQAGKIGEYAE